MSQQKEKINIFRKFYATLQEAHLDPSKVFSMATNECPSMFGGNQRLQGLIDKWRIENNLPFVLWHHCILHQESLVAKSLTMPHVTKGVITTVN